MQYTTSLCHSQSYPFSAHLPRYGHVRFTYQAHGDTFSKAFRHSEMVKCLSILQEMILGTADKSPPPLLTVSNNPVHRVTCLKLLGINLICVMILDGMHMLMLCVLRLHQDCIFLSYLNVLGCQPIICCVSINQLFVLFWSMVQLYGIITLHTSHA